MNYIYTVMTLCVITLALCKYIIYIYIYILCLRGGYNFGSLLRWSLYLQCGDCEQWEGCYCRSTLCVDTIYKIYMICFRNYRLITVQHRGPVLDPPVVVVAVVEAVEGVVVVASWQRCRKN